MNTFLKIYTNIYRSIITYKIYMYSEARVKLVSTAFMMMGLASENF